jgi:hypothetical protein
MSFSYKKLLCYFCENNLENKKASQKTENKDRFHSNNEQSGRQQIFSGPAFRNRKSPDTDGESNH